MSITSVDEVLTPKTENQLIDEALAVLGAADPPIGPTAMQPGSILRTLVVADARALEDVHVTVAKLAAAAFLDTAAALDDDGAWLDLRARSTFALDRVQATRAQGTVTLTCSALAGPETIPPAGLVITTPAGGYLYRSTNSTGVIVPNNGSVTIPVRAEGEGTAYNRSLAGASIVAPAAAGMSVSAASGTDWIDIEMAIARESNASLVARCRGRWATIAFGAGTQDAYSYVLRSATMDNTATGTNCGVTRVGFTVATGTGEVGIAIAGSSGLLTDSQRNAVRVFVASRKPLTDTVTINHSATVAVDLSTSTVRFKAGQSTLTNQAKVQLAVENYVNGLPMGNGSTDIFVDEAAIAYSIFAAVQGLLIDVDLNCGDVAIPALTIATVDASTINFS